AGLAGMPGVARADDDLDETPSAGSVSRGAETGASQPPASSVHSAETGGFLPTALSATSEGRHGLASVMTGWDQARRGNIYDTSAEAQLVGPVSLSAGASYDGPGTIASPHVELRLDALRQARHGLDLAVAAGYVDVGFNTVPAAVFKIAAGRRVGAGYLLGNVVYGQGLQAGERHGELRLAALHPITRSAQIGVDTRFQIDLERDHDEPAGETDWESRTGLVASYAWNRLVVMGSAGVSALRLRAGGSTAVGPVVMAGFGTVF
ncbi:MAG TPA: hypothetical protein VF516_12035, partial [Kofleriaceae bacterium]